MQDAFADFADLEGAALDLGERDGIDQEAGPDENTELAGVEFRDEHLVESLDQVAEVGWQRIQVGVASKGGIDMIRRVIGARPARQSAGLPEKGVVFCCFNQNWKITAPLFEVWMQLLREVPESILWLRDCGDAARSNLRREAQARGVDPDRLVFASSVAFEHHMARLQLADIFLDTLPYNAHATASDALWAGVPVVTCKGEAFAGRVASSLLLAAGLPELVTATLADYEALALKLARDPAALVLLREKLARSKVTAPLFDTDRTRQCIEAAYRQMLERAARGEPPASFKVAGEIHRTAGADQLIS